MLWKFGGLRSRAALPLRSLSTQSGMAAKTAAAEFQQRPSQQGKKKQLLLSDGLQQYLVDHTPKPELVAELRQRTEEGWGRSAQMMVPVEQGHFLTWLVATLNVRKAVEVGTFTGSSALAIAQALPSNGTLIACDLDPRPLELAQEIWQRAGVRDKIEVRLGAGAESLQSMLDNGQADSFDFAFIDADKKGYLQYYQLLIKLVRVGGVIAADNTLWYGQVADPEDTTPNTEAIREFNRTVSDDKRVSTSLIPVGDGIHLIRRLH
ncbi:hypothetical protein WJX73_004935 [Symbiochloris irregularis]|uniref:O-methyltransferase n=1 Tax=Symbiochloris irregularis TaxID=706552 RepID=A0AAW1NSN7_9CHLO